ncbi:MAG TPA: transglycosylase domain-containing protein [Leptospiraceae bacterium]|nr:transglycosylase domain-containing protein [Leptospiraceae bacterium]HMW04395.1 transglycosylase domain-containing protein [Leptospiraceae bacterium]HMY34129.1 transglycosylase domain-containing protein [Leptospiraceae bacterium]HMZ63840.1 transglycosylase domain-containing protein [Leptospiraceae bacterium]HNC00142.1 transglycosylase domain-containing protein [Leptospiraceae bacterium]
MKTLYNERILPDGSFFCESCHSKSKLSTLPNRPGTYKITCYKCKHETLVRVEEENSNQEFILEPEAKAENTPKVDTNKELTEEEYKKYESIFLQDTQFISVGDAVNKPLLEINKVTLPKIKKQETWFEKFLQKFQLPEKTDSNRYLQFAKKYRYFLAAALLILISISIIIPIRSSYIEVKSEVDELLVELNRHKPSKILDRNGVLVSEIFQKKTGTLKLSDYPPKLIKIILSVEDQNFYKHGGIDYFALLRATYKNIINMGYIQGASTITQQLARILIKDRRKSIGRKFREAMVAIALESKLSKDQILEAYLNQVYLGHGAFGIENGAKYYFNKTPDKLKTMEMILLSSLASAPNRYSPFKNRELSEGRVRVIVNTLEARNIISERFQNKINKFYETLETPASMTVFGSRYDKAPFVTEHIREFLKSLDPNINIYDIGGYTIETTLIQEIQEVLSDEVALHLNQMKEKGKIKRVKIKNTPDNTDVSDELQAAVVAVDPSTGAVLFMHGGGEQFNSKNQFNRAVQMRRQTGSSIKPILYASAIDSGIFNAASILLDAPIMFSSPDGKGTWTPDNFGSAYEGEMNLRDALAKSKNTIAVQIGERMGLPNLEKYYSSFFFPDPNEKSKRYRNDLSVTLGSLEISPIEMAAVYGNFSNDGIIKRPYLITRILNQEGKEIYKHFDRDEFQLKIPEERRVIAPDTAEVMVSLMKGSANASGIRKYGYSGEIAGKTGTTNDNIDAWFVGTRPRLSMAIWMGYDDASYGMGKSGMGAELAAPLWARIAKKIKDLNVIPEEKFAFSKHATRQVVCRESGLYASDICPDRVSELFTKEGKPNGTCRLSHDYVPKLR